MARLANDISELECTTCNAEGAQLEQIQQPYPQYAEGLPSCRMQRGERQDIRDAGIAESERQGRCQSELLSSVLNKISSDEDFERFAALASLLTGQGYGYDLPVEVEYRKPSWHEVYMQVASHLAAGTLSQRSQDICAYLVLCSSRTATGHYRCRISRILENRSLKGASSKRSSQCRQSRPMIARSMFVGNRPLESMRLRLTFLRSRPHSGKFCFLSSQGQ
jgi:hypothetical protein